MAALSAARALLFVPGDRPDRFAKAAASGADGIVLDLEDAIAPARKALARNEVRNWLRAGGRGIVRINPVGSPWYEEDVRALAGMACPVLLPKTSSSEQVRALLDLLPPGCSVVALLETAAGILNAPAICATSGVVRAAFGNGDLGAELRLDPANRTGLATARSTVVLASAAARLAPPLDGVTLSYADNAALESDLRHALDLGFGGKLCIHPGQVPLVRKAFAPSPAEVRWARDVVNADRDGSVTTVNQTMIDRPILDRAKRILAETGFSQRG
ncbi:HpcH/HpaI aldolase/citrate lyase family protein [Amycolatopsis rubida]|uniref:HpcH/HpaI aldolase/citrate lyase family protein n=1 Tax=Amycolatopsis rubida TaxID=112413 RepID=UPI0007DFDE8C|nr:Citrate lyase subunit beta-like protein [Amycolatopsis sp. M39]